MLNLFKHLACAASLLIAAASLQAQQMALTFDDLPRHGVLPAGVSRAEVARVFVDRLKAADVEIYGFMNAERVDNDPSDGEVLRIWRDAGLPLASHAYSHMDFSSHSTEEYKRDIDRNEPALEALMEGENWKWFRYPYLREGDTLEKRREIRAYLKDKGYRTAQVTLDFGDYMWNAPYARCVALGDEDSIDRLEDLYLASARDSITAGQELARLLFDRDVKHTMLLHIGAFTGRMLPGLLELLDELNFELVTLAEAHSDPAYESDPDVALTRGETLLRQIAVTRQLDFPRSPDDGQSDELAKFCPAD